MALSSEVGYFCILPRGERLKKVYSSIFQSSMLKQKGLLIL